MQRLAAVNQRDLRAVTPEVERGDGGGVLASDDQDFEAEVGVGFVVVVRDLGQVFARDVEVVGQIVVAGGND